MCSTCGCGQSTVTIDGAHAHGPLGTAHAPGTDAARIVAVEEDLLARNDHIAAHNRADFERLGVLALNLMSAPGAGKTTLLVETLRALGGRMRLSVIEGDQQTDLDAARIRAAGARAVQVNTGRGCHLDAEMVRRALPALALRAGEILCIENVGNLVCPAGFDLGERAAVVILSVTEGDDKPLKYPDIFRAAALMLISKSDLLSHVPFDVDTCTANARRINPDIEVMTVSALTGAGMEGWLGWIEARRAGLPR